MHVTVPSVLAISFRRLFCRRLHAGWWRTLHCLDGHGPYLGSRRPCRRGVVTATLRNVDPIRLWAFAQVLMCAGVALPALYLNLGTVSASALLVGGTFMVVTMAGMQTARQMRGAHSSRLMAAMTAAFATGQLIAPLLIGTAVSAAQAIRMPSLVAAALLFLSVLLLVLRSRRPEASKEAP